MHLGYAARVDIYLIPQVPYDPEVAYAPVFIELFQVGALASERRLGSAGDMQIDVQI